MGNSDFRLARANLNPHKAFFKSDRRGEERRGGKLILALSGDFESEWIFLGSLGTDFGPDL